MSRARPAPRNPGYTAVVIATAVVQIVLVSISLPVGELFTATPLLHIDAAHHWYEVRVAVDLAAQGKLVGFDPLFAAGYAGGIPYNTSARAPALLAALSGGAIGAAQAFKLFSFVSAILGPLAIPLAARSLGLGAGTAALAALFAVILWWASPVHWYHTAGIVAWPIAAFMASWFAAGLAAYVAGKAGTGTVVGMTILGCLMFVVHPLFPLAAVFAMLPLLWHVRGDLTLRRLAVVALVVPAVCIAANLPWIVAMLHTPGMADGNQPYQQSVDVSMIWRDLLGLPSAGRGSKFYFVLAFFALWGVAATRDVAHRRLAAALSLGALATVVFADVGAAVPALKVVQPNRFSFQAYILLLLPAALGVSAMAGNLRATRVMRGLALASSVFGAVAIAYSFNEVRREVTPGQRAYYGSEPPEVRDLGPVSSWALEQLRTQTDRGARVMFELSHARVHDGAHIAGYLAVQSDREFIGGQYPYMHFANVWDDWMFGRPLGAMSPARFREYLSLYNIGWILAHSSGLKRFLADIPGVVLVSSKEPLAFYRVAIEHSFFAEGSGRVVGRGVNRIDLADLKGDVVVLKYHYLPGMRAQPGVSVDGVRLLDDPTPFIRMTHPPPSVRLTVP